MSALHTGAAVRVDPGFARLLAPLAPEERTALEQSILAEGCRDALLVWETDDGALLLDGHNRKDICERHGIAVRYQDVPGIADREDAELWIMANQLARRNLRDEQRSYLRGKYWKGMEAKRGRPDKDTKFVSLSDVAAREHVHTNTVLNDARFAAAVDTVERNVPGARETILAGESGLPKAEVVKLAKKPRADQQAAMTTPGIRERVAQKRATRAEKVAETRAIIAVIKDPETDPEERQRLLEEEFEKRDGPYHLLLHCAKVMSYEPEWCADTMMHGGALRGRAVGQKDLAEKASVWLRRYAHALGAHLGIEEPALQVVGGGQT